MYKQFQQNQTSYQTTQICTLLPKIAPICPKFAKYKFVQKTTTYPIFRK